MTRVESARIRPVVSKETSHAVGLRWNLSKPKHFAALAAASIGVWMFPHVAQAQAAAPKKATVEKDQKAASVPRRDISGIWEPVVTSDGIQPRGALAMPADGRPEHELPYTALGLEAFKRHRPANGPTEVAAAEDNDPVHICDPQGFPRINLFELRTTQILQTPLQVVMLYEYDKTWRVIWTDGRALPKDPEPRWFGYSVGKWRDDYTFAVETGGTDERTWLDNAGRPHSDDLRAEELFHRVDHDTLELSVTIDDPQFYTRPWVALNKLRFKLKPPNTEIREMIRSPSETEEYNKKMARPAAGK
jgi:hypothetical protein